MTMNDLHSPTELLDKQNLTIKSEVANVREHTPHNLRQINTFMKRKTHMGKKAKSAWAMPIKRILCKKT